PTWTKVDGNSPGLPGRACNRIAVDPANNNRVYVVFSGYSADNVWRTDNGGNSWIKIVGPGSPGTAHTLPRAPVNAIVLHPAFLGWLYVGTDLGVSASPDFGANWPPTNAAPANVDVEDLVWRGTSKLVAVTHGRSMFEATINTSGID